MPDTITTILEDLTGQKPPSHARTIDSEVATIISSGIGYSQFNEIMLLLGYDRVSQAFFDYISNASKKDESHEDEAFTSLEMLRQHVDVFRKSATLRFGNIKYAFKYFSSLREDELARELELLAPVELKKRHSPVLPIKSIPGHETYYLGYIVKRNLDDRLRKNPDDAEATNALKRRDEIVEIGRKNHEAYLVSDHLDVYVATSMREQHEYQFVSDLVAKVFAAPDLAGKGIRWFDPTQAYCEDRIDKGLAEGLMLKRAKCTLHLAQESDTLGKDSELATTLAQGKPVVAYVPLLEEANQGGYIDELLKRTREDLT